MIEVRQKGRTRPVRAVPAALSGWISVAGLIRVRPFSRHQQTSYGELRWLISGSTGREPLVSAWLRELILGNSEFPLGNSEFPLGNSSGALGNSSGALGNSSGALGYSPCTAYKASYTAYNSATPRKPPQAGGNLAVREARGTGPNGAARATPRGPRGTTTAVAVAVAGWSR